MKKKCIHKYYKALPLGGKEQIRSRVNVTEDLWQPEFALSVRIKSVRDWFPARLSTMERSQWTKTLMNLSMGRLKSYTVQPDRIKRGRYNVLIYQCVYL